MESSFVEYCDKTGIDSESDDEVIDNSLVADESFGTKKTPGKKNATVFIPESEESSSEAEQEQKSVPKSFIKRSSVTADTNAASSEDDTSRRGSIRHINASFNRVVLSSSSDEEAEVSPEIVPKRRPPFQSQSKEPASPSVSVMGRRKNKRMILMDSDTDNSIILEHNRNKKLTCLKDTPLKIAVGNNMRKNTQNDSIMDQSDAEQSQSDNDESEGHDANAGQNDDDDNDSKSDDSDDEPLINKVNKLSKSEGKRQNDSHINTTEDMKKLDKKKGKNSKKEQVLQESDSEQSGSKQSDTDIESDDHNDNKNKSAKQEGKNRSNNNFIQSNSEQSDTYTDSDKKNPTKQKAKKHSNKKVIHSDTESDTEQSESDQSEGDAGLEDQLIMSRATRMSIMGVVPQGGDSDDSDCIVSDEKSRSSSAASSLPDISSYMNIPNKKPEALEPSNETANITCSPFSSPLHDITNEIKIEGSKDGPQKILNFEVKDKSHENLPPDEEVTFMGEYPKGKAPLDDDVAIVDTKPEVIALSSDDEEPKSPRKKSPRAKSETRGGGTKGKETTMKQYLQPNSYPNQLVYVKKHVLENELSKLEELKQDLHHLKYMMDTMDLRSLPDNGRKLIERMTTLERQLRAQGDKVATLVIAPDEPTQFQMANDGFEPYKPSWEELQRGSQAVQPRMFGKQAMSTHMAERNLILERLRDLHASLDSCPSESTLSPQPKAVRATLMPHQLHALAWLQWRETQRPSGGILADDMGLGKTITMISLVVSDKERAIDNEDEEDESDDDRRINSKMARGGTLVVCPASLIQQWSGEVKKHCSPHAASVCLHHGPSRATHPHRLATNDIVVTTYNILQRDNEKNGVLMKIKWRRIILDEAHIVRNHKSATSTAVSALHGRRRWCLTGTPVHNKDLDLFALLKFLRCTPFDELTMWKKWIDNKSAGGQERLNTIMRCILLRRTKVQLQQKGQLNNLPTRTPHQVVVKLDTDEMNVYQKVLVFSKTLFAQFLHQRAEKQGDAGAGNDAYYKMHKKMIALQGAKPVKSHEILVLLLRLRQVCCHCGLIAAMLDERTEDEETRHDPASEDLLDELNKMSLDDSVKQDPSEQENPMPEESTTVKEAIRSVLSPNNPVFALERQSSKIRAVMDCLKENVFTKNGEKAVVVSQWTSVLRLVETELRRARVRCVTLSGAVAVPARAALIDAINDTKSDVTVMLLSLCAGGVGLNLVGANHLLLLDPHWNPQLEEQAQDRVYRLGQAKAVHIYRFMCMDTVEQSIRKLQESKLEMAENVLTGAKNTNASKLTIEDLKMLFNMGQTDQQPKA